MHLILGLALTFLLFLLLRQWMRLEPADKRRSLFWAGVVLLGLVCTLLVVTGRLHVVGALLVGLGLFARRGWRAFQLWLLWRRIRKATGSGAQGRGQGQDDERRSQGPVSGRMGLDEARAVLNVTPDADRDTIRQAHRRLIQKVHPDRGGSDELAARVNEAKEVLLKTLGER